MACIFCKIIKGEIPCAKIAETAKSLCFLDINPLSKGHLLVIPKEHQEQFHQLAPESVSDTALLLHKVAKVINAGQAENNNMNYNLLQNNGRLAHQVQMHVHFHLIPKTTAADGLGIRWDVLRNEKNREDVIELAAILKKKIEESESR